MSFLITEEKFKLLEDPSYHPICAINPIISCGSVMQSGQAATFGFPNPFIGLVAFGAVAAIGAALLAGGVFKRWFWLGLEAGSFLGMLFVHYLFFESVYRIHALCPFCIVTWIATITAFWYVTLYNIRAGNIRVPKSLTAPAAFIQKHHGDLLALWLLIIAGLILHHFWYYFGSSF